MTTFDLQDYPELTGRQREVFTALLQLYVTTAQAVGSRSLVKRLQTQLSPATVRNVMADLQEMGLLMPTHTSSGRVPTTLGYGYYVDQLMDRVQLGERERKTFAAALEEAMIGGINDILDRAGEALANVSTLISVVLSPKMAEGILHKIDLVRIATGRLLMVLSIRNGFVRSILLEISSTLQDEQIESVKQLLNQRLSGLTFEEVRKSIGHRLAGTSERNSELVRLVVDSADRIFQQDRVTELHVDGAHNALNHPEFADSDTLKGVIEVLEDRDVIVHLLESGAHEPMEGIRIGIGEELGGVSFESCSIITARYVVGDTKGSLGIIGPKRMDYARLVSLVDFAANSIRLRTEGSGGD